DLADDDAGLSEAEDALPEAAAPPATPRTSTKRRARTKPAPPPSEPRVEAAPAPKPASAPKPSAPASPKELLARAKQALSSGKASEAYRLAAQANQQQRNPSAIRIMARAACRMGNKAKAKSAFDRLSISDRSGIRSECRQHGVRLGL